MRLVLEDAKNKLSSEKILAAWPADFSCPAPKTLWRWLDRAVKTGLVCRDSSGKRSEPFRYWLAEKEAQWQQDPMYQLAQLMEENQKNVQAQMDSWNKVSVPVPGLAG